MDRLLPALLLIGLPVATIWRAARRRQLGWWHLVGLGAVGGLAAGVAIAVALVGGGKSDSAVAGLRLGATGVGAVVGVTVASIRAWWRGRAPPA